MGLCTMLVQAVILPLVLFQGTANAVANITDDMVFYGQSPPVYPSRESQSFRDFEFILTILAPMPGSSSWANYSKTSTLVA